jgi:hypothetical protein
MECVERPVSGDHKPNSSSSSTSNSSNAGNVATSPVSTESLAPSSPDARRLEPEEKAKRTKHTRVQKREKELYGLVTPVFLPLLDARDTSPQHDKKQQQQQQQPPKSVKTGEAPIVDLNPENPTAAGDGEKSREGRKSRREHSDMADSITGSSSAHCEASKKSKRASTTPTTKKSALRQHSSTKPRRKRVSLVIDGHTVLPADTVIEPALTSPSSEATSASNSTASLDDMIDPRLTQPEPHIHTEHSDAMHHSLPLPMSNNIHAPSKPLIDPPGSITIESARPPILPTTVSTTAVAEDDENDQKFNTYVGGLRGSGADDVDQAGSYGYPSSLGASYLESYMQSRPLKVRMEAADKAGLEGVEKREMVEGRGRSRSDEIEEGDLDRDRRRGTDEDVDMDIMGEMEGF